MSTQDFKGKEIIVSINTADADGGADSSGKRRRGIVDGAGGSDYLARRVRKKTTYINFYDLGMRLSGGAWLDDPFFEFPIDLSDPATVSNGYPDSTADVFVAIKNYLLAVPLDQWKATFRKFEYAKAERFAVDVNFNGGAGVDPIGYGIGRDDSRLLIGSGSPVQNAAAKIAGGRWTEKGFDFGEFGSLDAFQILTGGAFMDFRTNDADGIKITSAPDFSAPAVPFAIKGDFDVFLVPKINHFRAYSLYATGRLFELCGEYVFTYPKAYSREILVDDTPFDSLPFGLFPRKDGNGNLPNGGNFFPSLSDARKMIAFYTRGKGSVNSKLWRTYSNIQSPPPQPIPDAEFPASGLANFGVAGSKTQRFQYSGESFVYRIRSGALLAVIVAADALFYVWAKVDLMPYNAEMFFDTTYFIGDDPGTPGDNDNAPAPQIEFVGFDYEVIIENGIPRNGAATAARLRLVSSGGNPTRRQVERNLFPDFSGITDNSDLSGQNPVVFSVRRQKMRGGGYVPQMYVRARDRFSNTDWSPYTNYVVVFPE